MMDYLPGALRWLRRRTQLLRSRLEPTAVPDAIRERVSRHTRRLDTVMGDIDAMLQDSTLGNTAYLDQNLVRLRTRVRTVDEIELVLLPLVESWGPETERMQALVDRVCRETQLPASVQPLVALYGIRYFEVDQWFDVIYMPRLEGHFLLHMPDLYHEIGHVVVAHEETLLLGSFDDQIEQHFVREHRRASLSRHPLGSGTALLELADAWKRDWKYEFACDMVAAYLCGASYGWANVHLCASKGGVTTSVYEPHADAGPGDTHPADEARWRAVQAVLHSTGLRAEAAEIERRWRSFASAGSSHEPPGFAAAYPPALVSSLQRQIRNGLSALGVRFYRPPGIVSEPRQLSHLLNEAWTLFWQSPEHYPDWEARASLI